MKSPKRIIAKRSVIVSGRQTSVSVEDQFWAGLTEIATELELSMPALVTSINPFGSTATSRRPFVYLCSVITEIERWRPVPSERGPQRRELTPLGLVAPAGQLQQCESGVPGRPRQDYITALTPTEVRLLGCDAWAT
jgi:hypothetical protein